jgi:uncharacterized membrane protein YkvA (DUF1232 family)
MVWSGVLLLLGGAILTFAVGGDLMSLDVRTAGAVAMILGAVLAISGITRLNRGRRRRVISGLQGRAYRTSKGKMIAMIIAVVYILSPIDFIPDVFLPVGIIDDATAFSWLLFAIGQEISRKRRQAL